MVKRFNMEQALYLEDIDVCFVLNMVIGMVVTMNYADIKRIDVANGPGVRVSLFVSGCTHHCKECFNPETWDFSYGNIFDENAENEIIKYLEPDYIKGLTLLGGDPMEKVNQEALIPLLEKVKKTYPDKSIWCYTGYDFEEDIKKNMLKNWEVTKKFMSYIDVLVDGEFKIDLKDLNLVFRGSSNQRIIMVKESLESGKIVLWEKTEG